MVEKIRPLGIRLFVARAGAQEKTQGGLYIPESSKEKGQTGVVIAAGLGKVDSSGKVIPLHVKVGDTVFFGKYAGTDVDTEHLILKEDDILAVIEK